MRLAEAANCSTGCDTRRAIQNEPITPAIIPMLSNAAQAVVTERNGCKASSTEYANTAAIGGLFLERFNQTACARYSRPSTTTRRAVTGNLPPADVRWSVRETRLLPLARF